MCHCTPASVSRGGDAQIAEGGELFLGVVPARSQAQSLNGWSTDISWRLARSLTRGECFLCNVSAIDWAAISGLREDDRPVDHPPRSPVRAPRSHDQGRPSQMVRHDTGAAPRGDGGRAGSKTAKVDRVTSWEQLHAAAPASPCGGPLRRMPP